MKRALQKILLLAAVLLPVASTGGCATILGTAVSPLTGGIDLNRQYYKSSSNRHRWYWAPFIFIGGAVSGPFVALYNGAKHDVSIFRGWHKYWRDFGDVFEPFEMINRRG